MPGLSRLLDEAKELLPSAVLLRRRIHENPELGLILPLTTQAVLDGLQGLDIDIARGTSTSGLIVSLTGTKPQSQSGRTILLRGDMDALPMPEETGLDFASKIPGRMHACGQICTRPCSLRRCISCTAIGTSCPAPSSLCSSPARRDTPAPGA
jgi:hippurate hydrolase